MTQQDITEDGLFEDVLHRLSASAFTCIVRYGVRDINAFLELNVVTLTDVSPSTAAELTSTQQWVSEQFVVNHVADTSICLRVKPTQTEEAEQFPQAEDDGEIFLTVLQSLGTRSQHALVHARVENCAQFLALDADVIAGWPNAGAKTVAEILTVQQQLNDLVLKFKKEGCKPIASDVRDLLRRPGIPIEQARRTIQARRLTPWTPVEHCADDPEPYSVLRQTLLDLFTFNGRSLSTLWETASSEFLGSVMNLPESDWEVLRAAVVFEDDTLDSLLVLTLGYLMEMPVTPQLFDVLINTLITWIEVNGDTKCLGLNFMASEQPIVASSEILPIRNLRIRSFGVPQELLHWLNNRDLVTWGDLTRLSEKAVLRPSSNWHDTLSEVRTAWRIKSFVQQAMIDVNGEALRSCTCLRDLADRFASELSSSPRDHTILLGRWGLLDGRKWSQSGLARKLGISQMHVSRTCEKLMRKAKSRALTGTLAGLRIASSEYLSSCGGACLVSEMAAYLSESLQWVEKPSDMALVSLLQLCDDLTIDKQTNIISDPRSSCLQCPFVVRELDRMFAEDKKERTVDEVRDKLVSFCQCVPECHERIPHLCLSDGFVCATADKAHELIVEAGVVYRRGTWGNRRGSRAQIAERIVKAAGRPMHWKEIYSEIKKLSPEDERVTEHNVSRWIDHSPNILLWGRGTYVHRDHVRIPRSLIRQVESWLAAKLDSGVPFVSVAGPWAVFEDSLTQAGIPSESALYACLRDLAHPKLAYPRYPYVVSSDAERERLPVSIALEQYILDAGGLTTFQDIKAYAIEELCIAEQLFSIHLYNVPNVVRAGKGQYVHTQNLTLDHARLGSVLSHVAGLLAGEGHVSVEKVYSDKQISCKTMGIDCAEMLYAVLQGHADDNMQLPGYPQIVSIDYHSAGGGSRGVLNEVVEYIALRESPCSFEELEQHFAEELGYNVGTVYNVIIRDCIVRYSRGSVVHLDTLEWTEEKQSDIEDQASTAVKQARGAGRCYGSVAQLLEFGKLPRLGNDVVWTQTLLAELLARGDCFRILGNTRNAFVELPNEAGVETFEDLVYELLRDNYEGASDIEAFEQHMRTAGIVQKRVTPGMLGDQRKVIITGHLIMLRELHDHA